MNEMKKSAQTPFPGRRTAKIESAGDGHYLHLQTQFGEDRCTDTARPSARPHKHTNTQTGLIIIYCAAS